MSNWLNANKILLNVSKTELIMSKAKMKKLDFDLILKLNGKKLCPNKSVKYFGTKIDKNLVFLLFSIYLLTYFFVFIFTTSFLFALFSFRI